MRHFTSNHYFLLKLHLLIILPMSIESIHSNPGKSSRASTFGSKVFFHRAPDESAEEWKAFFSNQSRLIDRLFDGYNRNVPAVFTKDRYGGPSRPQRCNTTLFYAKLLSIDEPKQCALMIIDIIYSFVDPRLTWNPEDYDGIKEIPLTKKETIWIPDVLPYDIMSYTESIPEERQIVNIYYNGTISFYSTAVIEFICHLQLANFPFDEQTCLFRLTSFNIPTSELNVTGIISNELNIESLGNGEWIFRGVTVENDWYEGQHGLPYSMVVFYMQFRRTTTYYCMLIIVPSFILTFLCLSGLFWRSIEKDGYLENLNLGLTAILAMMLILQMTTENIPKIDEINKLSRYSMVNLGLITTAILLNMCLGKMEIYRERNMLRKEREANKELSSMLIASVFITFSIFSLSSSETLEEYMEKERKVLDSIFRNYSADVPVIYTRGRNLSAIPQVQQVNITLMYSNLLNIDEPAETIHMIVDTYLEWTDHRLKWNSANFDGIQLVLADRNKVWVPDVVAYDIAQFDWGVAPERQRVVINSLGRVSLLTSAIIGYNCELDITNFPFDDQVCAAKFSCYYSTNREMVLIPFYDPGYDVNVMSSNAWKVIGSEAKQRIFHDYVHGWNYSEVNFLFTIRRSDTYYVVLIIIPSYVLSFLCMAGLFWSKITYNTYMEKLNLGYAGILAMVLILQMTTQEMPKTWQLPILSLYTLVNLSSLTVASLAVLIVGKAEGKYSKSTKTKGSWTYSLIKRVHLVLLFFFLTVISVNLIVLCTKKEEVRNREII